MLRHHYCILLRITLELNFVKYIEKILIGSSIFASISLVFVSFLKLDTLRLK